jgi:hypothetical protein
MIVPGNYAVPDRASAAVAALEAAWKGIQRVHPGIPAAVLVFLDVGSRGRLHGYFARSTWKKRRGAAHEVAVSPKFIRRSGELLATMLHEAAHAVLYEAGLNAGIGSTRYYHTKEFRDQCKRFGLKCEFLNTRYGWTLTSWPATGVPAQYRRIVDKLRSDLPAGTGGYVPAKRKGRPLPNTGHTMLICSCEGGDRSIYVKKSVLEEGGVTCSFCGEAFQRPVQEEPRPKATGANVMVKRKR